MFYATNGNKKCARKKLSNLASFGKGPVFFNGYFFRHVIVVLFLIIISPRINAKTIIFVSLLIFLSDLFSLY